MTQHAPSSFLASFDAPIDLGLPHARHWTRSWENSREQRLVPVQVGLRLLLGSSASVTPENVGHMGCGQWQRLQWWGKVRLTTSNVGAGSIRSQKCQARPCAFRRHHKVQLEVVVLLLHSHHWTHCTLSLRDSALVNKAKGELLLQVMSIWDWHAYAKVRERISAFLEMFECPQPAFLLYHPLWDSCYQIIPILQIRKVRFRELGRLVQDHINSWWVWIRDSNPRLSSPNLKFLILNAMMLVGKGKSGKGHLISLTQRNELICKALTFDPLLFHIS